MAIILPAVAAAGAAAVPVLGQAIGKTTGHLIVSLSNLVAKGNSISSLADLSRPARVEPLVLVEKSLEGQPYMEDLMKFGLTTFTGYYMQAVSMITNVGKIDTLKVFDSLNPYRSQGSIKDAVWSNEAYQDGLPKLEAFHQPLEKKLVASLEDADPSIKAEIPSKLFEADNLAVGKLINVELKDGDHTAKIPVLVRLVPVTVPSQALSHIFTAGGRDSWGDRYRLWKGGQISFVRDLIFGMDMVDQHRKALANDSSGALSEITTRRRNNIRKQAMTGTASMADASNIAVITKQTAKEMGRALYGKLENKAIRDKIFDNSYLLVLMVVDDQYERVTVYHRGVDLVTNYSFREIKGMEKNKGQDVTEMFKVFHQMMG